MKQTLAVISMSVIIACLVVIPLGIWAQPGQGPQGQRPERGRPPQPPQEAFDACQSKQAGAACTVATPRGDTLTGTCQMMQNQLACVPNNRPNAGQYRPQGVQPDEPQARQPETPQRQQPSNQQGQPPSHVPVKTAAANPSTLAYPVVDTGQTNCYNNTTAMTCPQSGQAFYGQDAQYTGNQAAYKNNGDGTVTDLNTGLMWQRDPGQKMTYAETMKKVGQIVVMGGAVTVPGNISAAAEFNFFVDPHAAQVVMESGIPVVLVGLDVAMKAPLPRQVVEDNLRRHPSRMAQFIADCTEIYMAFYRDNEGFYGCYVHDPLAITTELFDAGYDPSGCLTNLVDYLTAHRNEISAVIAMGDVVAEQIKPAFDKVGIKPGTLPVVGWGNALNTARAVKEGYINAATWQFPEVLGYQSVFMAYEAIQGWPINYDVFAQYLFTKQDVDKYIEILERVSK